MKQRVLLFIAAAFMAIGLHFVTAQTLTSATGKVDWKLPLIQSRTQVTLQLVVNPEIRRGAFMHNATFKALRDLKADMVRFVPWLPYPRLAVAELEAPTGNPQCAVVPDGETVSLNCPTGVVSSIQFASYGTPSGRCGEFKQSSCSAATSMATLQRLCMGKASCSIPVNTGTFGGDPCFGTHKWFAYQASCSNAVNKTSWNFTLIDPMMEDLMDAQEGRSTIINFSTTPQWMWNTPTPITFPTDPNQVFWSYEQGGSLRDPSMKELSDYYMRLVAWYTKGGFEDEYGVFHKSNHFYDIPFWEVLNEVDAEHSMSPEFYTKVYDAIVLGIQKVQPNMKFMGMALAGHPQYDWFAYFLNASNHAPGIPLDWISYHFYASAATRNVPTDYLAFFSQADNYLQEVRYREEIRKALAPHVKVDMDEVGVILPNDNDPNPTPFPPIYWNAAGAMYAYLVFNLAHQGIDRIGESQLVGYPTQFPSVSMIDWNTAKPTARYWILDLLLKNFGVGDILMGSYSTSPINMYIQGYQRPDGSRRIAVISKGVNAQTVTIEGVQGKVMTYVDVTTGYGPAASKTLTADTFVLNAFAVAIIKL